MQISDAGIELIKDYEGCVLTGYRDPVGVPTIGVGHTRGVKIGDRITEAQAGELLREDMADAEDAVNDLVTVELTQNQYDSLCSLVFNIGAGAFARSTLLRHLNAGRYLEAANQFPRWSMAGGQTLPGLVKRRYSERARFMDDRPSPDDPPRGVA